MGIRLGMIAIGLLVLAGGSGDVSAQPSKESNQGNQPTYHVVMVPGTITAVNYQHRASTEIGFQGSPILPLAKGKAKVTSRPGRISIEAEFRDLQTAQKFGPEYWTYVLWAITPEGKANNLGELLLDGSKSKISVTTSLQTFGMIVTAEPYFAVSEPSDAVVLANVLPARNHGLDGANGCELSASRARAICLRLCACVRSLSKVGGTFRTGRSAQRG